MCSRFSLTSPAEAIRRLFGAIPSAPFEPRPAYAPTDAVPLIRAGAAGLEAVAARWGLVPGWADDLRIGTKMINARGETVAEKPAFRQAFARRRGLVPADGFTEWREVGAKRKQPLLIRRQDGAPMAFAALWEVWSRGGAPVLTCSIVTTGPNAEMAAVHDRMPVILDPADFALWLDPAAPAPILQDLLRPAPDGLLRIEAGAQPPGPAQMVLL